MLVEDLERLGLDSAEVVARDRVAALTAAESVADSIRRNADNQRHVGLDLVDVSVLEVAASA